MSDFEDDDTAAMAQAMGFSSFGSQRPTKKRRYDAGSDSRPHTADDEDAHDGEPSWQATSANSIPIHQSALRSRDKSSSTTGAAVNADAIDLEENPSDSNDPPPVHGDGDVDASKVQSVIDRIVAANPVADTVPPLLESPVPPFSGPGTMSPETAASAYGVPSHGSWHNGERSAVPRQPWWEGYYDPASNANPWAKLEEKMGLSSRGSWLASAEASSRNQLHGRG